MGGASGWRGSHYVEDVLITDLRFDKRGVLIRDRGPDSPVVGVVGGRSKVDGVGII